MSKSVVVFIMCCSFQPRHNKPLVVILGGIHRPPTIDRIFRHAISVEIHRILKKFVGYPNHLGDLEQTVFSSLQSLPTGFKATILMSALSTDLSRCVSRTKNRIWTRRMRKRNAGLCRSIKCVACLGHCDVSILAKRFAERGVWPVFVGFLSAKGVASR